MEKKNFYSALPDCTNEEIIEKIISTRNFVIERIVSHGQRSPSGFWYDQENDEWVIVLSGRARLKFQDDDETVDLIQGDYLLIPAHVRHRVEWTDPDGRTIWLAIHFKKS